VVHESETMASLSDRKLRNVKKRAFAFKYTLGEGETPFDVPNIVKRFVGENTRYGIFAGIGTNQDGSRTVQTVLSVPSRLRISSFAESKRWRNAGANVKRVSDVKYPEGNSSVRSFLEKWARDVARRPVTRQMGSEKNLFTVLDKYQDWEAGYKFRDGRVPKKAKTPRKRYRAKTEVDEQTSTDELSHSDTGDEFTNPIKEGPRNGMTNDEWACEALLDIGLCMLFLWFTYANLSICQAICRRNRSRNRRRFRAATSSRFLTRWRCHTTRWITHR
jgi:hypothetical protein